MTWREKDIAREKKVAQKWANDIQGEVVVFDNGGGTITCADREEFDSLSAKYGPFEAIATMKPETGR